MKNLWMSVVLVAGLVGFQAQAAENEVEASTLTELLQMVKDGKVVNGRLNERREKEFNADNCPH